jgi:hypothetical protein
VNGVRSDGSSERKITTSVVEGSMSGGRAEASSVRGGNMEDNGLPGTSPLNYGLTGVTGWIFGGLVSAVTVVMRLYHTKLTKEIDELKAENAKSNQKHEECQHDRERLSISVARLEERLEHVECKVNGRKAT